MLIDSFGRTIDYLRVSVTQNCNFRCQYCMPDTPLDKMASENLLSFSELFMIIKVAIDDGVRKVRITGGEPLLRDDLNEFIRMIKTYNPDVEVNATTNGFFLKRDAKKLYEAGLNRINISLDSLKREVVTMIAKRDVLGDILEGINSAIEHGFKIKINMVPLKKINDGEICDMIEFCKSKRLALRFIEFMENEHAKESVSGLNADEILQEISKKYTFKELKKDFLGPARLYEMDDGYIFGIIEPHSDSFCDDCNRLRLSAEGHLIPCLYFEDAVSLASAVKSKDENAIRELMQKTVAEKPEKNRWSKDDQSSSTRAFYYTGG